MTETELRAHIAVLEAEAEMLRGTQAHRWCRFSRASFGVAVALAVYVLALQSSVWTELQRRDAVVARRLETWEAGHEAMAQDALTQHAEQLVRGWERFVEEARGDVAESCRTAVWERLVRQQ